MNFIQEQLEKQKRKEAKHNNERKPVTKLPKHQKNFKPMRAK